jgi:serine phosphatase RsbU (regulator of sigma subunit)
MSVNKNNVAVVAGYNEWRILFLSKDKDFPSVFVNSFDKKYLHNFFVLFELFTDAKSLYKRLLTTEKYLLIYIYSKGYDEDEITSIVKEIREVDENAKYFIVLWSENPWTDSYVNLLENSIINDVRASTRLIKNRLFNILYTNINNYNIFLELEQHKTELESKIIQRTEELNKKNQELIEQSKFIEKQNVDITLRNQDLEKAFKKSSIQHIKLQKALYDNENKREELLNILKELQQKNEILKIRNEEIASQRDHIEQQNEEIQTQRDLALKQRDKIVKQQNEINDNIQYARRIQQALLPPFEFIKQLLPEYFIFNCPKNIVSGDFYWVSQIKQKTVIVVGDCTGHGISGAMMSMLGAAFLNEVVNNNSITDSSQILEQLRKRVITSLHQKVGNLTYSHDGMDVSVCIIDIVNDTLQYSGANNPLYIIRKNKLIELKPDKIPIGIHEFFEEPYVSIDMNLYKGDSVYMFSDGFADQFGGKNAQKLKYSRFKNILLKINRLHYSVRAEELEKEFQQWMGENEQVDDILVLGFNIV